jgi:hypothetical protein
MSSEGHVNEATATASKFINNTNRHVFLTGKAGTGKTTFLRKIIKHTFKKALIAAPTGIAAINAGGVTLHSLFQLPFGAFIPQNNYSGNSQIKINTPASLVSGLQLNTTKRKLLQELELLIIDEVSMLRADLLDAIDLVLRTVRRKNTPFGGVQLLFIGDLLQLPPVVKEEEWRILKNFYPSIYFFDALCLRNSPPLYIELNTIYRQADQDFIDVLNNLRSNQVTSKDIDLLNRYYKPGFKAKSGDGYIQLTTHNNKADSLNREALALLPGKSWFFKAVIENEFNESAYPLEETIELKKGAQVMFIKNDPSPDKKYYNGKIGIISSISDSQIEVSFSDSSDAVSVSRYEWQNIKYELDPITNEITERVIGTFSHYPIKLAWAITVHKSQGLTFDKAIIDIGSAFAPGQVYVALSRLTSLEGLVLSSAINTNSLHLDEKVKTYSSAATDLPGLDKIFAKAEREFFHEYICGCFSFTDLHRKISKHLESYQKSESKQTRQKHFDWALSIKDEFESIKVNADKFVSQLHHIFLSQDDIKAQVQSRVLAAQNYFEPLLKELSKKILSQCEIVKAEKRSKQYHSELAEMETWFFRQLQMILKAAAIVKLSTEEKEFLKEDINTNEENQKRLESLAEEPLKGYKKKKGASKNVKVEKPDTKAITYQLYKSGLTIEQIMKERNMVQTTIENHLSYYVSLGLLDIHSFVEKEKIEHIISVAKHLDTLQLGPIKQSLGEEYSYSDIRFVLSYYQNSNKKSG